MSCAIDQFGIFAKYWNPGDVKTRLAATIGDESAADVQREFLSVLLHRFRSLPVSRVLCFAPPERRAEFTEFAGPSWQVVPQSGGDLGQRMASYFRNSRERGVRRTVLIGSDSPTVPAARIEQAFQWLESRPVVLGPSGDGGYYLVGVSGDVPPIFDEISWGTSRVWQQTLDRLTQSRVNVAVLEPWYDVDELEDLRRLAAELDAQSASEYAELTAVVKKVLNSGRKSPFKDLASSPLLKGRETG